MWRVFGRESLHNPGEWCFLTLPYGTINLRQFCQFEDSRFWKLNLINHCDLDNFQISDWSRSVVEIRIVNEQFSIGRMNLGHQSCPHRQREGNKKHHPLDS
jgi:hypothetical protein